MTRTASATASRNCWLDRTDRSQLAERSACCGTDTADCCLTCDMVIPLWRGPRPSLVCPARHAGRPTREPAGRRPPPLCVRVGVLGEDRGGRAWREDDVRQRDQVLDAGRAVTAAEVLHHVFDGHVA